MGDFSAAASPRMRRRGRGDRHAGVAHPRPAHGLRGPTGAVQEEQPNAQSSRGAVRGSLGNLDPGRGTGRGRRLIVVGKQSACHRHSIDRSERVGTTGRGRSEVDRTGRAAGDRARANEVTGQRAGKDADKRTSQGTDERAGAHAESDHGTSRHRDQEARGRDGEDAGLPVPGARENQPPY